jgi:prepilin-type N-terminal cleavage/methylation domain-containing protein
MPPPPAEHNPLKPNGFTLVEIAIVMVVIGLLVGGVFGGMRIVQNARVTATVQEIKSIESAVLTFRDVYRRPPGDLRNPSTRLANCTTLPCSRSGDGNGVVGGTQDWYFNGLSGSPPASAYPNSENFTFFITCKRQI